MSIYIYIILAIIIFVLLLKLISIKKSIKEIRLRLKEILKSNTNNLLTISTNDKNVKNLAQDLNIELKNLREQRLQYESGNQELKKTITNISHDLRTPLTAISGYIDLIKENDDKIKTQKYLKVIERKTNDLINLTENFFDFAKTIDIGIKINKEKCCINELLEEALANYYSVFKEHGIVPDVKICKEKIYRTVNKNTIIRVFENILSNINKYSNGDVRVILENTGNILFSNKATSLDATTVQKIFDRYFTVENAKKSNGIGLSIAKQFVELNEGHIKANYKKGNLIIEIQL